MKGWIMRCTVLAAALGCALLSATFAAPADAYVRKSISIPPESLDLALRTLAKDRHLQVLYRADLVQNVRTAGAFGSLTSEEALTKVLLGTGLSYKYLDPQTVTIVSRESLGATDSAHSDRAQATEERSKEAGKQTSQDFHLAQVDQRPASTASSLVNQSSSSLESSTTQSAGLDEIIVTAQKRDETLHEVPMGITALRGAKLNELQVQSFEGLAALVPALSVESIAPGQSRLTLRGENVGSVGTTVATYIDETPFGSSNALANGSVLTGDFDPWDLARVEVLRGPQGTLYGAGAEGGLLKYVTNAPDPTAFAAAIQVAGEHVEHGQNVDSVKAMVNLPIGDRAALRLSAYNDALAGYINDPSLGEKDVNAGYKHAIRGSLLINFTDDFSVRLTGFDQQLHTGGFPYIDVVGAGLTPLTPPANQLQATRGNYAQQRFIGEPSNYRTTNYSVQADWNMGWASLTSISSYGITDQNLFGDETSTQLAPGVTWGDLAGSITGAPAGVFGAGTIDLSKFTQEFRLASPSSQRFEWQVGAFFTHEVSTLFQSFSAFNIPGGQNSGLPPLETAGLDATYQELAGFGNFTVHLNSQFDVGIGGRWSTNKQVANETIGGLLVQPPQQVPGSSTGNDFTYSIAPRWNVTADTMVYARVATGYRPGGPNALPPGSPPGVPREYSSDTTVNYEIGTRANLWDRRFSIDVAAFYIDWKKIQLVEVVEGFGIDANGGNARSQGIEWTFGLTPLPGLAFYLDGAYIDATLTSPAPAAGGLSGDHLPYAPELSTSLDGSYKWRAFGKFDAFVGATFSFVGSRLDDFSAISNVVDGVPQFSPVPRVSLPNYKTVNLRGGLDYRHYAVELYAKNLGDVRGISVYSNAGSPDFGGQLGIIQPRTVGIALTARFD